MSTYWPKKGDIGLVRISGAGGRIIRGLQWANGCGFDDYEHALGVTSGNFGGRIIIVEAEPGGAQQVELHYPQAKVRWLVCPDQYRKAMVAQLQDAADRKVPYSWLDYAAVGAHHYRFPVPHLKRFIESSGHMMCSQLVDWCAAQAGWHLFDDGRWPGYVPPCDLNALWHKHYALHNGTAY